MPSEGLEFHQTILHSLIDLSLPMTIKAMQFFLVSLNYYLLFIEDYAIYASIPYALRQEDFQARQNKLNKEGHTPVTKKRGRKVELRQSRFYYCQ